MTGNDVTYTYGTSGTETGRPVLIADGSGMYKCTYDQLGNVTDEIRTITLPQHGEAYNFHMKYSYDSWGRMLTMTYPDGEEITYTYQWGGDLLSMHGNKNGNDRTYIREIQYNLFGQKGYVEYGNATTAYYTYDALHRLVNLKSRDGSGALMQDIEYTFDNVSNVTSIANHAGVVNALGGGYVNEYYYDNLYRLTSSDGGGGAGGYNMMMRYTPSGRIAKKLRDAQSASVSETVEMFYGYCNDYQPHAVKRMFNYSNGMLYDLRWDEAGNLGQVSMAQPGEMFEAGRFLFWTEDNRMHVAADDKFYSYYTYDHSGERRLKLTGDNKLLDVNADIMATYTFLDNPTLYPSAYMVLTNKGYTKHYYAGTERVAARLGGGGLDALFAVIGNDEELQTKADLLFDQSLEHVNNRVLQENDLDCIKNNEFTKDEFGNPIDGIPYRMQSEVILNHEHIKYTVRSMQDDINHGQEKDVYFYHSDHLGSASWITDFEGMAVQHLQYLPYGEPYVNQHPFGYSERFTFTGKERDVETGYGYFGARYMDHELMTMWLSVDPMADKYPSISPYAYCAWNPVKLVDPNGREIYYKEGNTYFVYKKNAEGKYGFYNCSTGDVYAGDNQQYVNDLTKALGQLKEGKHGNKLVSYFEGHQDRPLYIQEGDENNQKGTLINWNNTDKTRLPVGATLSDPVQIEPTETFVSLGHEMAHARDAYIFKDEFNSMSRKVKEQRAMLTENFIRREHGLRQRTFYGLKDGGRSVDYDSYPALVLPPFPVSVSPRNYSYSDPLNIFN